MRTARARWKGCLPLAFFWLFRAVAAGEPASIYGIHGHEPNPTEFLNHIVSGSAGPGWATATVAVGANTNDTSDIVFSVPCSNKPSILQIHETESS